MAQEMILAKLSQLQEFGEKLIRTIGDVSIRVKTLEAVGAQANLIERILVNGDPLSVGENKTVNIPVPTRVNQLENDASYQENVIERIQVNGVTQGITGKTVNVHMPTAVSELTNDENYQTNVLEGVKVNGTALTVDAEKNVNVSVPTKVSQLTNDKTYQTKTEVENTVKKAVAGSKHTSFQKVSSVPAAADAKEDVMYLVMNSVTKHYDIYAKIVDDAGNFKMELLDDTTVDLSGYVQKEAGKGLSHNDFTDALLTKLNGIAEKANLYIHPGHTAYAEGLYKVTVDALGHVTKAVGVTKADITGLGIPGQDTHDWASITGKPTSYPPSGHTHDDRYYTESEINTKLSGKSDTGHTHDASALINALGTGTASPTDGDYIITQWAGTGTEEEKQRWIRRPASAFWAYIKGKTDTLYQAKGSYAAASHIHDDRYYTESEIDEKLSGLPTSGHTHAWGDITGKPSTFTPSAHKHVKADITDFPTSMPASDVAAWAKAASKPSYAWNEITGKPSTFPPASHTHDDRYYTESELDAKLAKKADTHSHPYLPTAGGNMGGTAMIAWPDSGNWSNKNDGVTFPVKRGGLSWSGQSDGIQLFAEETGNDNLELILQFADDNSNGLTIRNKSGAAVSRLDANGGFSGSVAWEKITGKPSTFTPATHSHAWGDITGKPSTFAPSAHKHVKADITDFPTLGTAAAKNVGDFAAASHSHAWGDVTGKPSVYPPEGHTHKSVIDNGNSSSATTFAYSKSAMDYKDYTWLAGWNNYELRAVNKSQFATAGHTHNYAGSSSAGGTANSVNGFTFGAQTSDPGANSSLTTNKFLFVYE